MRLRRVLLGVALVAAGALAQNANSVKRTEIFAQALPKLDFRRASVITVDFPPGGEAAKHRHDVAVLAYVLEGSLENQIQGEPVKVFEQGQMWYEAPGAVHLVSRNRSNTKPAKLLVLFIEEEGKAATTVLQ